MHCVTLKQSGNNIADMAADILMYIRAIPSCVTNLLLLCIMYVPIIQNNFLVAGTLLAPVAFAAIGVNYSVAAPGGGLGVFRDGSTQETDVFSRWLGNEVTVGESFFDSQNWAQMEDTGKFQYWGAWVNASPGRMVTFGVAMFPWGTPGSLAECANGDYNQHWANIANNIAAAGLKNADLRMGWEFNGNWFIWSNIGKEADFAGCFRNVVTSMRRAQPNAGITFDWNPASVSGFMSETAWPGDQYIDYVGLDLYDEQSTSAGTTMMDQIAAFAKKHGKKLVFPEWGVSNRGNRDDPNYIKMMYEFFTNPINNVAWQVYFDVTADDADHYLPSFPNSAALYKQLFSTYTSPVGQPHGRLE